MKTERVREIERERDKEIDRRREREELFVPSDNCWARLKPRAKKSIQILQMVLQLLETLSAIFHGIHK